MARALGRNALAILCCTALLAVMPATSGLAKGGKGSGSSANKAAVNRGTAGTRTTGVLSSVTGGGTIMLTSRSPAPFSAAPFVDGRLHISLTARTFPNGRACSAQRPCGQFLIVVHRAKGGLAMRLKGSVTCASFAGHTAGVTGIVKRGFTTPRTTTVVNQAVGITVNDDAGPSRTDLVGLSAAFLGGSAPSGACAATPSAATMQLSQGNFTVHSATP